MCIFFIRYFTFIFSAQAISMTSKKYMAPLLNIFPDQDLENPKSKCASELNV